MRTGDFDGIHESKNIAAELLLRVRAGSDGGEAVAAGVRNEGHIRVRLNGVYYADLTDLAPLHLNLKDGAYNVTLQLVDNGGSPLNPDVRVSLHIAVQALVGRVTPFDATPFLALANLLIGLGILAAIYRKLEAR